MFFRRSASFHNGCFSLFAIATMATLSVVFADQTAKDSSKTLKMLSGVEAPFLFSAEEDGNTVLKGFVPDYIQKLGEILNSDIQLTGVPSNGSGDQTSELLKQLQQGDADIVGPLSITYVNSRVAEFSKPILPYGIVPVAKISTLVQDGDDSYQFSWIPLPSEVFLILKPFSAGIWLFTIFCFVAVSAFLYVIYRFNPRERRTSIEVLVDDEELGILSSFLFVFSSLVWQGYTRAPRSISGRILAAFWWTFTVIFLTSYTAKLVFYLNPLAATSPNQRSGEYPSLNELADRNVTFGVIKNSPDYYFFRQSRIKVYEDIWSRMSDNPAESFVSSASEGFQKAREGNFVFLVNSLYADYVIEREPCDLVRVGRLLSSTGMGLAMKINSPLRDVVSLSVLELRESGFTQKLILKWWQKNCDSSSRTSATAAARAGLRSMTVTEFGGAFILLLIGAVLAAIALLLEILFVRRQKRKEQGPEVKKTEDTGMADTPAETAKV